MNLSAHFLCQVRYAVQMSVIVVVVVLVVWHRPVTGAGAPGDTGAPALVLLTERKESEMNAHKRARRFLVLLRKML